MPMLIQHIDQIAREKKRDVLYLMFHIKGREEEASRIFQDFDYAACNHRKEVMAWLTANDIRFYPCAEAANEEGMQSYKGQLYVDVPFDLNDPIFQKLSHYLENPDGTMKVVGSEYCYWPLELSMQNAHHDAPGFWEEWAKNF